MTASVLIVGGQSTIAQALRAQLQAFGYQVICTSRKKNLDQYLWVDMADDQCVGSFPIPTVNSCVVLAAVTSMSQCESDESYARKVNVDNTIRLIERLERRSIHSVFVSSNQVFGDHGTANTVEAVPHPTIQYGQMKRDVELYITRHCAYTAILRLAKVLGKQMPLIEGFIEHLLQGQVVSPYGNYTIAPVSMTQCCRVIAKLVEKKAVGLYQLSAAHGISYYELLKLIGSKLNLPTELIQRGSMMQAGRECAANYPVMQSNVGQLMGDEGIGLSISDSLVDLLPALKQRFSDR